MKLKGHKPDPDNVMFEKTWNLLTFSEVCDAVQQLEERVCLPTKEDKNKWPEVMAALKAAQ